jgi:two-component system, LytTR family, response regulator LytT
MTVLTSNLFAFMNHEERILIVEDELLIADHISRILINAGYTSSSYVATVDEAVRAIESERPDIVLTDIMLNGDKTGIDLGALLHGKYRIPFVYITSHSSPEMLARVKSTYPNAYLVKPFKKEDLIVAIELALFNAGSKETDNCLLVKDGHAMAQIPHDEILWLEADGNYTQLHTSSNKRRLLRNVINELHMQLPQNDFIRIHRSFVVNRKRISEYTSTHAVVNDTKLPVGRTYRESLSGHTK